MAGLKPPFDYASNLIGEEVIYRALSQQERYAQTGKYGMTWSAQDDAEKSQAFFQANVMRTDFNIPPQYQNCVPEPPCPWDKLNDELSAADLMPIITSNSGVHDYNFKVSQRTDSGNSFQVGAVIAQYGNNQSALDPTVQSKFKYYEHQASIGYTGDAIIVIEKTMQGSVQSTFRYLFKMI